MQIERVKASIVAGWVLVLAAIAMSLNVGTVTGWLLLVGTGLILLVMVFRMLPQPVQTMSESIRDVLK